MIETTEPSFHPDWQGLHVVLVEPEIPQNSGNVARLCAGTGAWLHVVEPLGYALESRHLKRAGLDYWPSVRMSVHGSLAALEAMLPLERTWLYTTRAKRSYRAPRYVPGSVLVFGRESTGLPAEFVMRHEERQLRIPMKGAIRSLNLSNSVAVALYGVLDQWGWDGE